MMKLSLQLEMGMFSATVCGLVGVAFGMNLDSSLEQVQYMYLHVRVLASHVWCLILLESLRFLVSYWIYDIRLGAAMATIAQISW